MSATTQTMLPRSGRGGPLGLDGKQLGILLLAVIIGGYGLLKISLFTGLIGFGIIALLAAPFGGIPGYQWFGTIRRLVSLILHGGFTYSSRAHLEGFNLARPKMPEELSKFLRTRIELAEVSFRGGALALLCERDSDNLACVFESSGSNFLLVDSATQASNQGAFAGLLNDLASPGNSVSGYKWIHRVTPASSAEQEQFMRTRMDKPQAGNEVDRRALELYAGAVTQTVTDGSEHYIEQVLRYAPTRITSLRKSWRKDGGGLLKLLQLLEPHISVLLDSVGSMGVKVTRQLDLSSYTRTVRRSLMPATGHEISFDEIEPNSDAAQSTSPWPLHIHEERFGRYVVIDGIFFRSFYVPSYSRRPVMPHHLADALNVAGVARAVAIIGRPRSGVAADLTVNATATFQEGFKELLTERGGRDRATSQARRDETSSVEQDLVAGFTPWFWSMVITVWGETPEQMIENEAKVRGQFKRSKLRMHTMWGRMLEGVICTTAM